MTFPFGIAGGSSSHLSQYQITKANIEQTRGGKMKTIVCGTVAAILCAGCASNRVMNEPAGAARVERANGTAEAIPEDAQTIFLEIEKHQAKLKVAVQSNEFDTASHHAAAIRELASRIPQRSTFETKGDVGATTQKLSKATKEIERASIARSSIDLQAQSAELDALIKTLRAEFKPL
jgi:hypothetical protein